MLWEKEKFLITSNFFFSYSFLKTCTADTLKTGLVWERINSLSKKEKPDILDRLKLKALNFLYVRFTDYHNKILALSRLKAYADNIFIVAQVVQYLFDRVGNIVGKGKKYWFKSFSFSLIW